METALLLLLLLFVLWFASQLSAKLGQNAAEVERLSDEVRRLRESLEQDRESSTPPPSVAKEHTPPRPAAPPLRTMRPPVMPAPAPTPVERELPREERRETALPPIPEPIAAFSATPPTPPETVFSSFRKNLDWEKFIGENLINKLGIAILVLGIGFFVKFAIDQEWINEAGRVAVGILAGGVLLGVAHRLRQAYQAFSSVLVGGGLAVLYFTIAIAFHEYQLFSQTVAFLLMVGITGFTIFLAVAYNRIELAVLALIGGFASPFMASSGEGNYIALFTFILLLNTGILVLAYFKKWNLLNTIAYLFTVLLYGGWLSTRVVGEPNPPYTGALIFATLFYLVFFAMNIIHNIKEKRQFTAPEIMILLSNTFLYYGAGMFILSNMAGGRYTGLFTMLLGVFNFVFAYLLYQNKNTDRNLVYLLIGLVLTFLSLTAPVQLEGNYITMFWALEAVLLLWLSQRSGIALIRVASVLVVGLMCLSLLLDWKIYNEALLTPLPILLNKPFLTGFMAVAALAATLWLLCREQDLVLIKSLTADAYRTIVGVTFGIMLYLLFLLELHYQLSRFGVSDGTYAAVLGFYNYLYLAGLLLLSGRLTSRAYAVTVAGLAVIGIAVYIAVLHPIFTDTLNLYLRQAGETPASFSLHYLPLLFVLLVLVLLLRLVHKTYSFSSTIGKSALWFASFAAVFLASTELEHLSLLTVFEGQSSIDQQLVQIRKIGFPILWGVSSFVLMLVGMSQKIKTLRVISLTLFFLTLLKLFLFDIRHISEGGRIAAFICLGILLLVVSFMYQKLKNIILEDDATLAPTDTSTDGTAA